MWLLRAALVIALFPVNAKARVACLGAYGSSDQVAGWFANGGEWPKDVRHITLTPQLMRLVQDAGYVVEINQGVSFYEGKIVEVTETSASLLTAQGIRTIRVGTANTRFERVQTVQSYQDKLESLASSLSRDTWSLLNAAIKATQSSQRVQVIARISYGARLFNVLTYTGIITAVAPDRPASYQREFPEALAFFVDVESITYESFDPKDKRIERTEAKEEQGLFTAGGYSLPKQARFRFADTNVSLEIRPAD